MDKNPHHGNFLAGLGASRGKAGNFIGVDFWTFQKIAGYLNVSQGIFNKYEAARIAATGIAHPGTKYPYWGENYYQFRMSLFGYESGKKTGVTFESINSSLPKK